MTAIVILGAWLMIGRVYLNVIIGIICGASAGVIFSSRFFNLTPSDPTGFALLMFTGGFIAGILIKGTITEGVLRGAISGIAASAALIFTTYNSVRTIPLFPVDVLFGGIIILAILVPANAVYGVTGIFTGNVIRDIVSNYRLRKPVLVKDLICVVGICFGAGITIIALYLQQFTGYGIYTLFAGYLLFASAPLGGFVSGVFSKGGVEHGYRAGLGSAIILCLVLSPPVTLLILGPDSRSNLGILVYFGVSLISIFMYPLFGVLGGLVKSGLNSRIQKENFIP